ncbi:cytochrome b/b6 domain-containing protein [Thiocapsa sp.]|uniref:cytochrome b/b6 domain-containing protein n=1 Tax=Thiocapsa sp. TaxID=2024551 RepID=UPI0035944A47
MKSLYLYPVWLRLWHWMNALLFLTLITSGVSMHYAGADWLMPFATARVVHNTAGILLTVGWIGFVAANARSANARHYRIRFRSLIGDLIAQTRYYMIGIFRLEPHPFQVTETMKFNALQQLSYLGVMYGLMPILVVSGWAFLYSVYLPETLLGVGSVWVVAMTHVVVSYLLALFLLVHIYIITTGETVFSNLRAMITGWHRETDEIHVHASSRDPRETP